MAEIKIEKKPPMWPWILLLLAVIGILIYLFAFSGDEDEIEDMAETRTEEVTDTRQVALNNSTVIAYVSFIKDNPGQMSLDHEFSNEALLKFTTILSYEAQNLRLM